MKSFYEDPLEREKWGRTQITLGLYPTERHLILGHIPPGASVLNIGCGGGREAFALAQGGYRVTAVDLEEGFIDLAKKGAQERSLEIDCRVMDATKLQFADESFDAVVMVGQLIGHIRGRESRLTSLREARRVVRPGGVALFSTNLIEADWKYRAYFSLVNAARLFYNPNGLDADDAFVFTKGGRRRYFRRSKDGAIFHWYRLATFKKDLDEAGWRLLTVLRRAEYERVEIRPEPGETFYVVKKEGA